MTFGRLPLVLVVLLAFCAPACWTVEPPDVSPPGSAEEARKAWGRVLARHVDDRGRIDFAGIAADRADLEGYVAWIAGAGHLLERPEENTADLLNVYNALAVWNVLESDPPDDLGTWLSGFFSMARFPIGQRKVSLSGLENDVIRPIGEPRIHFALNCMVRACPRLPRTPFAPDSLDRQLEAAAREFFSKEPHVVLRPEEEKVRFSQILEWYREDFLAVAPSLVDYANRFRENDIPAHWTVEFVPYDWTLNRQPPD